MWYEKEDLYLDKCISDILFDSLRAEDVLPLYCFLTIDFFPYRRECLLYKKKSCEVEL